VILPDVNTLVYAHREEEAEHVAFRDWLQDTVNGDQPFGISDIVLSGFIRVVTHPKVFSKPSSITEALQFAGQLLTQPGCVLVRPGAAHWGIFTRLCQDYGARGNLVPDAFLAALAIESGCEWITTDRDFARFEGLRWRHPLR